eukprot:c36052_g1_i1 orf=226-408(-)
MGNEGGGEGREGKNSGMALPPPHPFTKACFHCDTAQWGMNHRSSSPLRGGLRKGTSQLDP